MTGSFVSCPAFSGSPAAQAARKSRAVVVISSPVTGPVLGPAAVLVSGDFSPPMTPFQRL